jgi:hypothetical protein
MSAPLCRDCLYHSTADIDAYWMCEHPSNQRKSIITGETLTTDSCAVMRGGKKCGPEGRLFEARPKFKWWWQK